MKTLDYLHLNEKKVADVVSALHELLQTFRYIIPICAVSIGILKDTDFSCCTANLKICTTMPQRKWMKSQNVS